jgi:hypothetical protein
VGSKLRPNKRSLSIFKMPQTGKRTLNSATPTATATSMIWGDGRGVWMSVRERGDGRVVWMSVCHSMCVEGGRRGWQGSFR